MEKDHEQVSINILLCFIINKSYKYVLQIDSKIDMENCAPIRKRDNLIVV
jgi:hypothetical protein